MPEASVPLLDRRRALDQLFRMALGAAAAPSLQACGTLPYAHNNELQYSPAFFRADRNGSAPLYLFGTLHIGLEPFYPLPVAVERAFDAASRLAVEIDAKKHWDELVAGFRPYVRLPYGVTLSSLFPPEFLDEVRRYFKFGDEQWLEMQPMQPWWVANFRFGTERDQLMKARSEYGVEQYLLAAARKRGKAIIELEKPIEQVIGLAGGSLQEQSDQLRSWFSVIKRRGGLMNDLISAWRRGDLGLLAELKAETWGDDQQQTSLRRRFFTERDNRMAEQLARLAEGSPASASLFIAVGAYHLVGEDSLLQGLQKRGYSLERIDTSTYYERVAARALSAAVRA